ncbi:cyclic nucleotide-binding protein [Methylobacterium sp. Leaf469]|uniref:Crp/Fnr family transcriptional regulator n=1 Tax=unclassified Methylobacterium TaxID=2615210 RepID=UPI0006F8FC06|nr:MULTISPECIES: Crp/Fnr family transcriptional regulator [unclassified Methylobacterium]KQP23751.1 cyclic nucleotide-binding protein [Methylobacterium sp. Leaf102]KQP31998.1 cyclic nucleotide-binding protein [Methylobacterium sp. Leaf100]KQT87012.1 cyclic nucleotide-binding protein [Methylobacterium sp. Leaf469]
MDHPLIAKLEQFSRLSDEDRRTLEILTEGPVRRFASRADIVREGEAPRAVRLILSGWACRYKQLPNGRRQIVALFLPGDLCDHNVFVLSEMDHSIGTLSPVALVEIPPPAFEEMMTARPRVTRALWWESLVNAATQREWILNLGGRDAVERLAHLFCELFYRLRGIGHMQDGGCDLPLTQTDLAEVAGLTPVHVNRTLQSLRRQGLLELRGRRLTIPDLPALERVASFNPNYLHLDRVGARFDA